MKTILLLLALFHACTFALDDVTLQLKWKHQFQFAGFYMAKEKGFYKNENINVHFKEYNSKTPVEEVLHGKAHFGVGDTALIRAYASGKPLTALLAIYQNSPNVLVGIKNRSFKKSHPTVEVSHNTEINPNIHTMLMQIDNDYIRKKPTFDIEELIAGETDFISAYISNEPYQLQQKGYQANILNPYDYGIDYYGDILFTSNALIKSNPELVKSFYRASQKGWLYAFEHIDETVDLILKITCIL